LEPGSPLMEPFKSFFHRLRNPIAGIRTTAQVLLGRLERGENVPESWIELATRIVSETRELERVVREMEQRPEVSGHPGEPESN